VCSPYKKRADIWVCPYENKNNKENKQKPNTMKKLALTIAIALGMAIGATAQNNGLFQRGFVSDEMYYRSSDQQVNPILPTQFGENGDFNGNSEVPLGSGIIMLLGLGAAYAAAKKRKED
jgi:hypothetical protein